MENKNSLQNERRQQNDINVTAGPRGIERVKVEAPETAGKVSRQQREGGWGRKKEGKKEDWRVWFMSHAMRDFSHW